MTNKVTVVALIGQLGRGGSERQLFLAMSHLDAERFDRHVIVFNPSCLAVYDEALITQGVNVWTVPPSVRKVSQRIRFLVGMFQKIRPAVVHSWTLHDNPYAGIVGLFTKVPVRWGSVRLSLTKAGFRDLPWLFRKLSLTTVSKLVVNSPSLVDELISFRIDSRRIILLPNAVEPNPQPKNAVDLSSSGIGPSQQVIGVVANIRERKNQLLFVEAMAQVLQRFPRARALIIGQTVQSEEPYAEKVRRRIGAFGLQNKIILMGFRADVADLYHCMDVFCLPSQYEGTPNALLEAMAAGCPIVATAVGGATMVIQNGTNGLLVPANDSEALAIAIIRILDESSLARRLGHNAQEYVRKNHGCAEVADQLGTLYFQALES